MVIAVNAQPVAAHRKNPRRTTAKLHQGVASSYRDLLFPTKQGLPQFFFEGSAGL